MNHASLFSGIGGFDLAAEWAGWTNVFNCEIEPFCKTILNYYWPDAIQYDDIRKTDFTLWRGRIDVLTGGFPCQPFSQAGKRKGTEDERHLWPEMLRAIREICPRWIVGENVRGIITWSDGMVFEQVCADLESEGYEVQPYLLPAAGVGAPHERYRTWFVAYRADARIENVQREWEHGILPGRTASDSGSNGSSGGGRIGNRNEKNTKERTNLHVEVTGFGGERIITDADRLNGNLPGFCASGISQFEASGIQNHRAAQHTNMQRCQELDAMSLTDETAGISRFGSPEGWDDWPTQPPVCGRDDELSSQLDGITFSKHRRESIKGFGNAVVPYEVLQLFEVINQMNSI